MNRVIKCSAFMLILVISLAVGILFFLGDYLLNAQTWVMSAGSPHVYSDSGSVSTVVTDRYGQVLMNVADQKEYSEDAALRTSIVHWLGDREGNISAPIVSYYSGLLTEYNVLTGVYTYVEPGPSQVTLTLSAQVQKAALEAMGDYKGTVAVYNYKTGEIICAVSTPAFDPVNLPDIAGDTEGKWDGAYVNRFLKSTYTPGSIFKIVTAAAALETIPDILEQTFECNKEVIYGADGIDKVSCGRAHGVQTFEQAFRNSCNCAFSQIANQLGGEVIQRYAKQMGIDSSISFDGITTASGSFSFEGEADVMVAWSAIGQHKDQVNPCQYMTMVGTIAAGGSGVQPYIVAEVTGGGWDDYTAKAVSTGRIMSTETALKIQSMMQFNVEDYYNAEGKYFEGLTVCAKSGTAEVGGGQDNSMFAGFVADEEYPLAFMVVMEDGSYGRITCVPIISQILAVCKEVMDSQ